MSEASEKLVHQDYWEGHQVEIRDSGDHRSLYFGADCLQSRMALSTPHTLVLSYTQYMAFSLLLKPKPRNILVVGIGAGSFIRFFCHHFPKSHIDAVDYSSHVINAARGYFSLPENSRVTVFCEDGRVFLSNNNQKQYDLILIDAFDDQGMAPTVYSDHFLDLCSNSLAPGGLVSCNLWSSNASLMQDLKSIFAIHFKCCLYLPVPDRGNVVALAMDYDVPWPNICLKSKELSKLSKVYGFNFQKMVQVAKQNNLTLPQRFSTLFN